MLLVVVLERRGFLDELGGRLFACASKEPSSELAATPLRAEMFAVKGLGSRYWDCAQLSANWARSRRCFCSARTVKGLSYPRSVSRLEVWSAVGISAVVGRLLSLEFPGRVTSYGSWAVAGCDCRKEMSGACWCWHAC